LRGFLDACEFPPIKILRRNEACPFSRAEGLSVSFYISLGIGLDLEGLTHHVISDLQLNCVSTLGTPPGTISPPRTE